MDYEDYYCAEQALWSHMSEFIETRRSSSSLAHFWLNYMDAVEVMLSFIRADRSGDWKLHLATTAAMLPVMNAYDRTNYSRWIPVYLSDMISLEHTAPEVIS